MQEFNKAQENALRLTKLQEQAEQARLKTQKANADAITAEAKARKANADAAIKEAKAKEESDKRTPTSTVDGGSRFSNEGQESTAAQTAQFEKLRQAEAEASIGATEYGASVNSSVTASKNATAADLELEKARLAVKKANSEQNVELQGLNAQRQLANKSAKEEALQALGLLGPYQQLSLAYKNASLNAKDLAVEFGVESAQAREAAETALALNSQLQTIDKTVGESQKNVGNYPKVIDPAGKALSNFTNLSSLAATGINRLRREFVGFFAGALTGGILAPAIGFITDMIQSFFDMNKVSKEVEEQQKETAEAFKSSADAAAEEISKVTVLKTVLESENATRNQKVTALKDLKQINTDYFGQLDLENFKVIGLSQAYDAYVEKLIRSINAKANIEQLTQALKTQNEIVGDINKQSEFSSKHTASNLSEYEIRNAIAEFNLNFGNIDKNKKSNVSPQQLQLIADLLNAKDRVKQLTDQIKGEIKDAFDPKPPPKAKKESLDSVKEKFDLVYELYKLYQQRKIKILDEESNDEKISFGTRLLLAQDYLKAINDLTDRTAQHEIETDNAKVEVLQKNLKKSKGTSRGNIAIEIDNLNKKIVLEEAKRQDERITNELAFQKKSNDIVKDEKASELKIIEDAEKAVENVNKETKGALDGIRATEKGAHDKLLKDKAISQTKYDKEEKKSINDNLIAQLQADLTQAESLRTLAKLKDDLLGKGYDDLVKYDNEIIKLKGEITSAKNEPDKKEDKKDKRLTGIEIESARETQDAIIGIVDNRYQKEIDAIERVRDAEQNRYNLEKEAIQNSTLSQQEKTAQIIALDKKQAENSKKLNIEEAQIKLKQAKFDRDASVLGIVENGALASIKAYAELGPALGLPASIAIGVATLAQIALVLSKPLPTIPSYGEGTDYHPGGPAIVGEKKVNGSYQNELVETPGGESFITTRPMLMNNLPKGSKVTSLTIADIIADVAASSATAMNYRFTAPNTTESKINDRAIIEAIENGSRMTAQALQKQKGTSVVINVDAGWIAYIDKNVKR